jgi:hypothetical protein
MYLAKEFETKDVALIRFRCSAVSQNGPHTQLGLKPCSFVQDHT